jgi:hypothetical protein
MAEPRLSSDALETLPLFPLPSAILLPYEMLPLHVFEPRYRALVEQLLETGGPLGIAQLAPGWEAAYEGRPALRPVVGVGTIVRHERLPNGRFNILVRGLARARIEGELPPDQPFRVVRASRLEERVPPDYDLEAASESLRRILFALCSSKAGPGAAALAQLAANADGAGDLADIVIAALVNDAGLRQESLQGADVGRRVEIAQAAIAELLVARAPASEARYRN